MWTSLASRPSRNLTCWACTASDAQSATVTSVSRAPAPTETSTLSASVTLPVCSRTTVASASSHERSACDFVFGGAIVGVLILSYSTSTRGPRIRRRLADGSLHLHFDKPVQLQRILHRQLLGDRLDEAAHDHGHRLVLGEA